MTDALTTKLREMLAQEKKATPGKWRTAMHGYNVKSDLTATEHDGDFLENICSVPCGPKATDKAVLQFQNDADLISAARNAHRPLVEFALAVAEWKCDGCGGSGMAQRFDGEAHRRIACVCAPIREALAKLWKDLEEK